MIRIFKLRLFVLGSLLIWGLIFLPKDIYAATFTVDSTTDAVDASVGNGVCATSGSVCTLRAAVQEANALAGTDTITLPVGTYALTISNGLGEDDTSEAGDLDIDSTLIITGGGLGSTIIDAGDFTSDDRVLHIVSGGNLTLSGVTVKNGSGDSYGGAIRNQGTLVVSSSTITSSASSGVVCGLCNHPGSGGGIANQGTMTLTDVTLISNTSGAGGGLYNSGTATLNRVSISGNTADVGGGIYNYLAGSTLALTNVTISGNTVDRVSGGGIYNEAATLDATNVTIYNNSTVSSAGGISVDGGTVQFKNTILASNASDNCNGALTSLGYNLSSDTSCNSSFTNTGDLNSTDPRLVSTLSNNGGSTLTHALQAGSPAIDAGTNTGCPTIDQRNVTRPIDGDNNGSAYCDIGAFEYEVPGPGPTSTPTPAPPSGCGDSTPGNVANLYVTNVVNRTMAEVRWSPPPNATRAHIRYTDTENLWLYALLNTDNDGNEIISGLNPSRQYWFSVAGVNGCMTGSWSSTYGPVPPSGISQITPTPVPEITPFLEITPTPFLIDEITPTLGGGTPIKASQPPSGTSLVEGLATFFVKNSSSIASLVALPTVLVILGPASLAFGSLWYYLTRLIVWLRGLIYFSKKKHRPWGVVYDGATKNPIPGAIVRLYKQTGELVETEVTGKTGAFSFLPKLGEYTLKIMMPGFIYPSELVTGTTDGEYGPLYYGSSFEIKDLKSVINYNIPLDPVSYSGAGIFNSFNRFIHHQQQWLEILLITLGSFASIVAVVENPILFNYAILGFYFLMFLYVFFRRLTLRVSWGTVVDENNQPVPEITLSLLESEFGRLVQRRVTDFTGRYQFIVPKGEYKVLVTSVGYEMMIKSDGFKGETIKIVNKEELINPKIFVKKKK